VQRAEEAIEAVASTAFDGGAVSQPALLGAAKGFESLLRLNAKTAAPGAKAVERLRAMTARRRREKPGLQSFCAAWPKMPGSSSPLGWSFMRAKKWSRSARIYGLCRYPSYGRSRSHASER
jgi:hypothetical protein